MLPFRVITLLVVVFIVSTTLVASTSAVSPIKWKQASVTGTANTRLRQPSHGIFGGPHVSTATSTTIAAIETSNDQQEAPSYFGILKSMVSVNGGTDWKRVVLVSILLFILIICIASRALRGKPAGVVNMRLSGIHIDFRSLIWMPLIVFQYGLGWLFGSGSQQQGDSIDAASELEDDDDGFCDTSPRTLKIWQCDNDNVCDLSERVVVPKCHGSTTARRRAQTNAELVTEAQCMYHIEGFGAAPSNSDPNALTKELEPLFAMIPGFVKIPKQLNLNNGCADIRLKIGAPMSYEQLAAVVKPFDLFSLRSNTPFSNLIHVVQEEARACTISTHVGMFIDTTVIRYPGMVDGEIYVIESVIGGNILPNNMDSVKDVLNQSINGIQIRKLRQLMLAPECASCLIMWLPLTDSKRKYVNEHIGLKRKNKSAPCRFNSVIANYLGKPYPSNPFNFFPGVDKGRVSSFFGTKIGTDYFCSEFVVSLSADIGLLPAEYAKQARSFYPADFFMSPALNSLYDRAHVIHHPHLDALE